MNVLDDFCIKFRRFFRVPNVISLNFANRIKKM